MTRKNAIKLLKEAGWHSDEQKFKRVTMQVDMNINSARDYYEIGFTNRQFKIACTCGYCLSSLVVL